MQKHTDTNEWQAQYNRMLNLRAGGLELDKYNSDHVTSSDNPSAIGRKSTLWNWGSSEVDLDAYSTRGSLAHKTNNNTFPVPGCNSLMK